MGFPNERKGFLVAMAGRDAKYVVALSACLDISNCQSAPRVGKQNDRQKQCMNRCIEHQVCKMVAEQQRGVLCVGKGKN